MTRALIRFAVALAQGDQHRLELAVASLDREETPPRWVEELVLQSTLMVGYPRTLVAAAVWRERIAVKGAAEAVDDADDGPPDLAAWAARGEVTCRAIYRENYDKLRANVRHLQPTLERWMLIEGYGRTIGRPGLDLPRRELCTVAQCAALDAPRQFHSHIRGALHTGATPEAVEEVVIYGAADLAPARRHALEALWGEIRVGLA